MQILPSFAFSWTRSRAGSGVLLLLGLCTSCSNGSSNPGGPTTTDAGTDIAGGSDASEESAGGDGAIIDAGGELPPGACAAGPSRVVPTPVTGKGPASLGTADSDGNGLLDVDEWGPTTFMALDTDFDGQPDYQDVDDDGDGLLDVHDPARLETLLAGVSPDTHVALSALAGPGAGTIDGAVRPGDRVSLSAPGIGCGTIIILEGPDAAPLNLSPAGIAGSGVYFSWPAGAHRSVSIMLDGRRSDAVNLNVRPASAPLLAAPRGISRLGSPVTLSGLDLGAVTAVSIDGVDAMPSAAVNDSVTFVLPTTTRLGRVTAKAANGASNDVSLNIVHTVGMVFTPAPQVTATFETASGAAIVPVSPATSTPVDVDALGPGTVTVLGTRPDSSVVISGLAWVLPEETSITVDMTTTALSLSLGRVDPLRQLVPASWSVFRASALALPEVKSLADTLAANAPMANAGAGGLGLDQSATLDAIDTAAVAVRTVLESGLASGTLKAPVRQKRMARQDPGDPIVDPPIRNDVTPSGYGDQGNVKIENDTSLFLSAAIRENDTKRLLVWHATTAYSHKFISPQDGLGVSPGGVEVFGASEQEFKAPSFRNAKIRVITPGQISPHPTDPIEVAAARALFMTTAIDRLIAPLLKELVGGNVEGKLIGELLVTHAYPTVVEAYQAMTKDGFAAGAATLLTFFQREFKEQGPFFSAMTDVLLRTFLEGPGSARLKGLAVQGALKLAPVLDALNKAATGVTLLKTIFDLETTPAMLDFDVAYKMSITDVGPKTIEHSNAIDVSMDLKGYLLYPSSSAEVFIPFVRLEDQDVGGAGTRDLRHDNSDNFFLASNGRAIKFTLPRGYAEKAAGPISVSVVRGSETARSPVDVQVTSDHRLDAIAPATGLPGATVTLTGVGFAKVPGTEKVVFTQTEGFDPTTGPRELVVVAATVTDTQLTAVVPMLDDNIAQWMVRAQRGVIGNERRSNGKLFRRGQAGPEGTWIHYYAAALTGDCTNIVDDLDSADVFPNGNLRWYLWDAGGGYCVRDNKRFRPASGTIVVNGNTVTATRCSENVMETPATMTGTWNAAAKAYVIPPTDRWTGAISCLRQVTFEQPINICIAKEACKVVLNNESIPVRFHCGRGCFSPPDYCPYANGVEADCY
jgi:hypothetical protein